MLELHYKQGKNVRNNIYVTRSGERIGTELPSFVPSFYWRYITEGMHSQLDFAIAGNFVFLLTSEVLHLIDGIHLCFIEEKPEYNTSPQSDVSVDLWPRKPIWHSYSFSTLKTEVSNFVTHQGAVFLPVNPAKALQAAYKKVVMVDTTSKGRWLFPHPDGSRAAFEYLQKTTLEDDYHRLMPYFSAHPELTHTFADLI